MKLNPEKLRKARVSIDKNLLQFCERTGANLNTWYCYEEGRRNPKLKKVLSFLNGYEIAGFIVKRLKPFVEEDICD